MSEKEKFYGAGMQKRRCVTPNRKKKKLWIQSLEVREATTGSNWLQFCCRQGDAYQRTGGKACATALGILRPTSAMVQQSLGHGENQRPPPSNVKKLLWQQHNCQNSARAWVTHRLKSSPYFLSCEGLAWDIGRDIFDACRQPFFWGREEPLHEHFLSLVFISLPFKLEKMLQATSASF